MFSDMNPANTVKSRILVVEDGPAEREALARVLRFEGYDVLTARDAATGLRHVVDEVDLVISDLRMGKQTGIDLMRAWNERRTGTPFIIVTAYGDVESAVSAMKLGARDYITKPIDPTRLLELVRSCLAHKTEEVARGPEDDTVTADRLLGDSQTMRHIREQIVRAASADSNVLVLGESGTGKELIARAIHHHSRRSAAPLVTVHMASVPENLVESELLGHVPGAYPGATTDRMGRFESAEGGTLFIDEIGDFPQSSQAKLLRVLETHVVHRLGSDVEQTVDVRLVAATSRDLRSMVQQGKFRSDLFYRLNVVTIEVPPLRERREDIPLLTDFYVRTIARTLGKAAPELTPDLIAYLCNYDWPGNVRELRNCLESMLVLSRGERLSLEDLPAGFSAPPLETVRTPVDDESRLDSLEKSVILQTLRRFDGNRTRTAMELGISVRTLQRRLKSWGMAPIES